MQHKNENNSWKELFFKKMKNDLDDEDYDAMRKDKEGYFGKLSGYQGDLVNREFFICKIEGEDYCYVPSYQIITIKSEKPSISTEGYWKMAICKRQRGHYPTAKPKSGKWLIFVDRKNVDEVWAKVKTATEENKLGRLSKVSTAKSKPADLGYEKDRHVICVYTDDWTDEKDVKRVREELRKLGITDKIPYKADEDTWSGKYRARGHTRISKYYE